MRFSRYRGRRSAILGIETGDGVFGLEDGVDGFMGDLDVLVGDEPALRRAGEHLRRHGQALDPSELTYLPPILRPQKILCIGLNYADHTKESPYEQPAYPTVFARFASSMVGHRQSIVRPTASTQLDFEGELVAIIGRRGRHIDVGDALHHVSGYSIFNDGSVRDYQFKSPQWTVGKNFDQTGGFGPCFVTADELEPGCKGSWLQTRLNDTVVQHACIDDMLFSVAHLVSTLSEAMTIEPGDVLVTGTPSGVGFARKPPLFMKHGDVCEVTIDGIGTLRNTVVDEVSAVSAATEPSLAALI